MDSAICPLCFSDALMPFCTGEERVYLHCRNCDLVSVPHRFFVSKAQEKAKYDNHRNTPENRGYCDFLNRLILPLQQRVPSPAHGLDFGSGPGPTLSQLMRQNGYSVDLYDPFYAPDETVFRKKYDFITATEVIEHLHHPREELKRLHAILRSGGILGVMTAFRPLQAPFTTWYYKRDLTHIRFFSARTFHWIARYLQMRLYIPQRDVVLLQKP